MPPGTLQGGTDVLKNATEEVQKVYNWTVDDVLDWLVVQVELPQYVDNFRINAVSGPILPRLAANGQYMTNILGIKTPVHRQKITVKSTDTVLFGAPRRGHSYVKDLALVASLLIAVGGCWLAYVQHKYSQSHLRKVMKDLDNLQKAEDALTQLQQKLEVAEKEQKSATEEKKNLELELKKEVNTAKSEADRLRVTRETTDEEIARLKLAEEELVQVRMALAEAEAQLDRGAGAPAAELQPWLQLTYEIETKHYEAKRDAAEMQLHMAKEMCEKIRRKRAAFLGSLRIAHTSSIDDTDSKIMSAKAALEDVKMDLAERSHRWQQMESICGFNITMNAGLQYLESLLMSTGHPHSSLTRNMANAPPPLTVEEADEDIPPGSHTAQVAFLATGPLNPQSLTTLAPHYTTSPAHAMVPSVPADLAHLRQRPMSALSSSYSGSCGSINTQNTALSRPRSFIVQSGATTRPQVKQREAEEGSDDSEEVANKSSPVSFDLGGPSTPETPENQKKFTNGTSLGKSQSVDDSNPRVNGSVKPRQLTTSRSDGALKALQGSGVKVIKDGTLASISSGKSLSTMGEENSSHEESTDSTSLGTPGQDPSKKKKKKKLFTRLLKPGSEKKSS